MNNRERFSSRLGFILISAGCAVGLGNVWRFPYITGQYCGAAFVLVYLIFLVLLGLPIMVMEFAVGRASQKSAARSFHVLEPAGTKWHLQGYACMAGNYLLMMFYTTVGGWMAAYTFKTLTGEFKGLDSDGVAAVFNDMLARPGYMTFWMVLVVLLSFFICSLGLQKGVERITKAMMSCLFLILLILCIRSVTLPGASEGLRFYLIPDFTRFTENGVGNTIFAAMGRLEKTGASSPASRTRSKSRWPGWGRISWPSIRKSIERTSYFRQPLQSPQQEQQQLPHFFFFRRKRQ